MANTFSPSMVLAGMDYIAPSAACIKPTMLASSKGETLQGAVMRHDGTLDPGSAEVLKITLQDCLACSGCVTTAETILVNSQSREELLRARDEAPQTPWLVTISDPSAASLAAHLDMSVFGAMELVAGFFKAALNCSPSMREGESNDSGRVFVSDLGWALEVSTRKTAEEYERRRIECPQTLPLLVSACPGWVCYCEKQGSALLPFLCPVMSPQGIAGSFAKRFISMDMYHVSIQPCFDRKLEAARDGFEASEEGIVEGQERVMYTDCVISTHELLEWMLEVDASLPWRAPLDSDPFPSFCYQTFTDASACGKAHGSSPALSEAMARRAHMEGSGGYHRRVMERLLSRDAHGIITATGDGDVHYEVKRNRNHQLVTSSRLPQQVFCIAYGFQQIQNVVRGLKKKLPAMRSYSFVELMACPDGCLNGGGQARNNLYSHDDLLSRVQNAFQEYIFTEAGTNCTEASPTSTVLREPNGALKTDSTMPVFSVAMFDALAEKVGPSLWTCTFHDRQAEFEAMLNEGNVHSLKW